LVMFLFLGGENQLFVDMKHEQVLGDFPGYYSSIKDLTSWLPLTP
jgi:hypothetical protein